ncbi:MAG: HyaD/HybD family hydrogenase maturation endopeptidase [Chloroflexi bacterium]|nr:HyaD/HybD family hydrogenase maturation endopeptidase [Chloroflexota bacterium]
MTLETQKCCTLGNILVLGLGNILLQDEGVGVRVVEMLQAEYEFPSDVVIVDGGTLGLELLAYVENAERVVIVDAVEMNRTPGALVRLENSAIPAFITQKLSPHQVGLQDMLALAQLRGQMPRQVVLWGIQGASFDVSLELSPVIAAQVPVLAENVLQELSQWNVAVERIVQSCDSAIVR